MNIYNIISYALFIIFDELSLTKEFTEISKIYSRIATAQIMCDSANPVPVESDKTMAIK